VGAAIWKTTSLEELAATSRNAIVGGPFGSDLLSSDYRQHGVPVIRGENLSEGRWISGPFVYVAEAKAFRLSANIATPLDVVFTQRGANHYRQVGVVPLVGPYKRYVISQSQMKITLDPTKADPLFIYYLFRAPEQQSWLRQNAIQTGVPHTNLSILRQVPVRVPPVAEQRAIASILGALDDKIELNRRMNETLEGLARALFDNAFGGVDTDAAFGDLATIERHGLDPQDHSDEWFDHYSLPAFDAGARPALERGRDIKSNKFVLTPGCVLLSKLNPSIPRVWFPRLSRTRRSIASTEFVVLRPTKASSTEHLNCLLRTDAIREHLIARASGTSNSHQRVKPDDLLATPVHRPAPDRLARFTKLARPLFELVSANLAQSSTLAETRNTLLPKLLSGELRVRDAERAVEAAT
jgi:type I restriction enzyme S subunit